MNNRRGLLKIFATSSGERLGELVCEELTGLIERRFDKLTKKQNERLMEGRDISWGERDEFNYIQRLWEENRYQSQRRFGLMQMEAAKKGQPMPSYEVSKNVELGHDKVVRFADSEYAVVFQESLRGRDLFIVHNSHEPWEISESVEERLKTHMSGILSHYAGQEITPELIEQISSESINPDLEKIMKQVCSENRSVGENTMEALVTLGSARYSKADRITLICPLSPFSRQDHAEGREGVTAELMARLTMEAASGASFGYLTAELHSPQQIGFFKGCADNLFTTQVLLDAFLEDQPDMKNFLIYRKENPESDTYQ